MSLNGRYHIKSRPAPAPEHGYPAKFLLEEGETYVKYGHPVFHGTNQRGDEYWTAEIITQTWFQAETGNVPISGAGYGGKFSGEGFDNIWLDMSEIVRPTRDGIHGREYVSTQVQLGGLSGLDFGKNGQLLTQLPPWISLPIPVMFAPLPMPIPGRVGVLSVAKAAQELQTISVIEADEWSEDLAIYADSLAARVRADNWDSLPEEWTPLYIEIEDEGSAEETISVVAGLRAKYPQAVIGVLLPLVDGSSEAAVSFVAAGVTALHFMGDEMGHDMDGGNYLPYHIRQLHLALVQARMRDQVTLIISGGIAAADQVAKAIACGADILAIDFTILIAWGSSLWADNGLTPVETGKFTIEWGSQRLINLMNAWRDQLLEALGAMGMRELRRLRGEIGRTIWQEEEETKFRALLSGSRPVSDYPYLPKPEGSEGDFRWPLNLLLSSQHQARTGKVPTGKYEYRMGDSDGGFDRLAFAFEFERDGKDVPDAEPSAVDLSLSLNRRGDERPDHILPMPWYGAGMSYGSIGMPVMSARARAAEAMGSFMSTGEGGYPEELNQYSKHIITQVATGLFGVREETMQQAPMLEIKYAQGAKPGLGGHLLGNKNTATVARIREAVQGTSLFSPFPFHSVYSVEDHKKHVDWLKQVNPRALISVKVSTPNDVDMVAVGSYYAGAHVMHIDGAYGGTGAAPEIAKKNIAMPIEYAIPRVHQFLLKEGIRDQITLMASGGLRTPWDAAKAIALGADGVIIGTAELVAIGCIRIAQCEKGLGCPFGITTTDPEHARKIDADVGFQRIVNLYQGWARQLAGILQILGMSSIAELRGRTDLLVYLEG